MKSKHRTFHASELLHPAGQSFCQLSPIFPPLSLRLPFNLLSNLSCINSGNRERADKFRRPECWHMVTLLYLYLLFDKCFEQHVVFQVLGENYSFLFLLQEYLGSRSWYSSLVLLIPQIYLTT